MNQTLTPEDRRRYDLQWASHSVKHNCSAADTVDWFNYRYTSRLHAYKGKILLVWRYVKGQPEILDTLTVTGIELTFLEGLQITATLSNSQQIVINSAPSKLPGLDVFVWVPALSELRFAPSQWDNASAPRSVRFALNFKQERNPVDGPEPNQHCLSELTGFRRMWPAFADTRF